MEELKSKLPKISSEELMKDMTKEGNPSEEIKKVILRALRTESIGKTNRPILCEALAIIGKYWQDNFITEDAIPEAKTSDETEASGSGLTQEGENDETFFKQGSHVEVVPKDSQKKEQIKPTQVCYFYKRNVCKFQGRGKGKCKFSHPKKCPTYMKKGPKSKTNVEGCDIKQCKEYHPKLCFGSLRDGECLKPECNYSHLWGTGKKGSQSQVNCEKKGKVQSSSHKSDNNEYENKNSESFLGMVTSIMEEIRKLNSRMDTIQGSSQTSHSQMTLQGQGKEIRQSYILMPSQC